MAIVFPKLQTVINLVKRLSWKRSFRTSFESQHVNGCQKLAKSAWQHFYHIFSSLCREMICKLSPLLKFEILGVFVKTLTADDRNLHESTSIISFDHSEGEWVGKLLPLEIWNLRGVYEHIEFGWQLSCSELWEFAVSYSNEIILKKKKTFSDFMFNLWNLHQILNIFEKKVIVRANVFLRLQTVKDLVIPLSKDSRFRTSFGSQHVKWFQTLGKSAWEHFYHIFWSLWEKMTLKISRFLNFEFLLVFVNTSTADENYPFGHSGDL